MNSEGAEEESSPTGRTGSSGCRRDHSEAAGGLSTSGVADHECGVGSGRVPGAAAGRIRGAGADTLDEADVREDMEDVATELDKRPPGCPVGTDGSRRRTTPHGVGRKHDMRHGKATIVFAPEGG